MKNFSEFTTEKQEQLDEHLVETIKHLIIIQEMSEEQLNEMFEDSDDMLSEGIADILKKSGLHVHKGKGLIGYLKQAGKGVAQLIVAAVKGDTETIKKIMKSVKKEDVIDLLLKLDMATLHLITGPIHTIDAITGWHLWANVQKAAESSKSVIKKIKDALSFVKKEITKVVKDHTRAVNYQSSLAAIEAEL